MDAAQVSSPTALGLVPTAWPSLPSCRAAPHILPSTRLGWLSDPLASFTICSVRASTCTLGALRYVREGGVPESLPTGCYRGLPSPVNRDELLVSVVPAAFSVFPRMLRNHPQPSMRALTRALDPQGPYLHLLWMLSPPITSLFLVISPMSLPGALVHVPAPFMSCSGLPGAPAHPFLPHPPTRLDESSPLAQAVLAPAFP